MKEKPLLHKGEEILVVFIPILFFVMLMAPVSYYLDLWQDEPDILGKLGIALFLASYYSLVYFFIVRKKHKSFLVPFIYGGISFLCFILFSRSLFSSRVNLAVTVVIYYYFYGLARKFIFKKFNFSEEEYNSPPTD